VTFAQFVRQKNISHPVVYPVTKKSQTQTVIREEMYKALLYKKGNCKMLMKLTPVLLNN